MESLNRKDTDVFLSSPCIRDCPRISVVLGFFPLHILQSTWPTCLMDICGCWTRLTLVFKHERKFKTFKMDREKTVGLPWCLHPQVSCSPLEASCLQGRQQNCLQQPALHQLHLPSASTPSGILSRPVFELWHFFTLYHAYFTSLIFPTGWLVGRLLGSLTQTSVLLIHSKDYQAFPCTTALVILPYIAILQVYFQDHFNLCAWCGHEVNSFNFQL